MIQIRLSYEFEEEAKKIIKALGPVLVGAKIKTIDNGKYKKIYIKV
jgi:hypothetical protein